MPFNVHERRHPLEPVRDRALQTQHQRAPPVPRAPRPKPRANSAGALAKDTWSRRPSSGPKSSEERRPSNSSPFSHARVSLLTRERDSAENQRLEMGPAKRAESVERDCYLRGHVLGQHGATGEGMPWTAVTDLPEPKDPARRNTLHKERLAADQALEWAPVVGAQQPGGRRNNLSREAAADEESREWSLGVRSSDKSLSGPGGDPHYHPRRNVIMREQQDKNAGEMPRSSSCEPGGAPSFPRRQILARERGVGVPQISCH